MSSLSWRAKKYLEKEDTEMKVNPHHTSDIRSDAPFNDALKLGMFATENPHAGDKQQLPTMSTFSFPLTW